MHSGYTFLSVCVFPGNWTHNLFALLTQCSTTEPQEHQNLSVDFGDNLLSVGRLIVVGDQAYHRCVIGKFDDDVGAVCSCTVVCVQGVQEWAEDAALRGTSVEDQGRWGVVAHSDHLTSACQEVQDPAAQRSVQSQSLELLNQCGRHYGVKCWTIIHEQHPHIGVLIFQVGESSVQGEGNSVVCGTVSAVCKL